MALGRKIDPKVAEDIAQDIAEMDGEQPTQPQLATDQPPNTGENCPVCSGSGLTDGRICETCAGSGKV